MYADESKMVAIVLVCLAILVALVMILICYLVARRSKCQKLRSSQSACATSAVSRVYTSFTGLCFYTIGPTTCMYFSGLNKTI